MRHRFAIRDLSLIVFTTLVGLYWAYAVDIFANEGPVTTKRAFIELDEALLIGALLAVALLCFAANQYRKQRLEVLRRQAAERYARELAYQDGLTGLPNRRQFDEALRAALDALPRAGTVHALFMLDLNGFKRVNDVHGHGIGDEVLVAVAQRLRQAVREGDIAARLGGDEFAVLATHLAGAEAATNIALRIIEALDAPIDAGGALHRVGAGIGIALLPDDAANPDEATRKADVALYRAKDERRSAMRFFEESMDARVRERAAMEQALRAAMASGAIQPMFRPTVRLSTQEIVGFEMVPQWVAEDGSIVPPDRFIPIAEEAGLIHALAEAVLRRACETARGWPETIRLAVDIYPSQLRDELLPARIVRLLHETGLPDRLELEITESALVADLDGARQAFGALRAAGVRIVLDNFGTGYSSLYHLRTIRLDKIKVDGSFVEGMTSRGGGAGLARALIGLGQALGLSVAADGIEDGAQQALLLQSGCDFGQGNMFSGPIDAAQSTALVDRALGRSVPSSQPLAKIS